MDGGEQHGQRTEGLSLEDEAHASPSEAMNARGGHDEDGEIWISREEDVQEPPSEVMGVWVVRRVKGGGGWISRKADVQEPPSEAMDVDGRKEEGQKKWLPTEVDDEQLEGG